MTSKLESLFGFNFLKEKKGVQDIDYVAQNIGNSHLIMTDMARPRMKDYEFSWKNIVSKDESAFMCHYAHARLFKYLLKLKKYFFINHFWKEVDFF